jgi:hypothetical protein
LSDYIIYDSRVAAAFALLIQQYFNSNNKEFNSVLKLDIPKGRESANSEDRRDIGDNFGTFTKDYKKHFSSNVKASWLLSKTVEKVKESNPDSKIKLRELEAALFMIGYDIRQN